jgi:hypothetical protein
VDGLQIALVWVLGVVITLFIPVLVWAMVIAGLIQIVRGKVQETHPVSNESARET